MNTRELKEFWKENDFRPNKKLGQNFLIDNNIREKIREAVSPSPEDTIIEIGPGFGAMTFDLADSCDRLYAVEKDHRICSIMRPLFRQNPKVELLEEDFLELDIAPLAEKDKRLIVFGNIPYYITTNIIEKIIGSRKWVDKIYLMTQLDFARRLFSPPGSKEYGSISCYVQFYTKVLKFFKVKKGSFYPVPSVDSYLFGLEVLPEASVPVKDPELMFSIIRKAFSQRRKKIINPLSQGDFLSMSKEKWIEALISCGIDPSRRAEELSLADYAKLSDSVR